MLQAAGDGAEEQVAKADGAVRKKNVRLWQKYFLTPNFYGSASNFAPSRSDMSEKSFKKFSF